MEKAYRIKTIIYRILGFLTFVFLINSCEKEEPFVSISKVLLPVTFIFIIWQSIELFITSPDNKYFGSFLWKLKKLIEHKDPILKAEEQRLFDEQFKEYQLRKGQKPNS